MSTPAPIRVLIADDHPVYRNGLSSALTTEPDIEVVGSAPDGTSAIEMAADLSPDVILMDIRMPATNGIDATRRILQTTPQARILILTMFDDDDSVFASMRAGSRGYLLKGSEPADIARAVRAAAEGDAIFGAAIAERMIALFARRSTRPFPSLTDREHTVLTLLAAGKNNQAIAAELSLSLKTVRNYVSNIFNKLHVADRAEAMLKARAAGLGQPE